MAMTSETKRFIEFRLQDKNFAVPLSQVQEVIRPPETTPIPKAPEHFRGVTNLRGQVISIVKISKKLGLKDLSEENHSAVIILDLDHVKIGIEVDDIVRVFDVNSKEFEQMGSPKELEKSHPFIESVINRENETLLLVLDIFKALDVEELKLLNQSAA